MKSLWRGSISPSRATQWAELQMLVLEEAAQALSYDLI